MPEKLTELGAQKLNEEWEKICFFNYKEIESQNHHLPDSLYPHLGPEALYTSFADYYQLFSRLPETVHSVCDLGSGVGRLAPIWKKIRPEGSVSLVELVESRAMAAKEMIQKLNLSDVTHYQQDLLDKEIPLADAYFIYLPVSKVLEKIIASITQRQKACWIVCIESHGNLYERLSDWRGLELIQKVELFSKRHDPYGHIYYFTPTYNEQNFTEDILKTSFQKKVLVIEEKNKKWLGLSEDLCWASSSEVLLRYPPRTLCYDLIKEIKDLSDFSPDIQELLSFMREGREFKQGQIRKIWLGEQVTLEMQSGAIINPSTLP